MYLSILVPCYNEEAVLAETNRQLLDVCTNLVKSRPTLRVGVVYVDDGSKDATWPLIAQLAAEDPRVAGIRLAHNAGHQHALWAGLEWASRHADAAVSIDADLQDDVNAIFEMVEQWMDKSCDIVYGVRKERKTDTFFKRQTAQIYYKLLQGMGGDIVYNHADFRLMSRRALQALMDYPERNVFLRGLVRTLGFTEGYVYYDRGERMAGTSKYPLHRMLALAVDGITSFSVRPLTMITYLGLSFTLLSLLSIVYAITSYLLGKALPGWTSLLISVWFIGGAILTSMGVMGIYVGKIYNEVKRRPRYCIRQVIGGLDQ